MASSDIMERLDIPAGLREGYWVARGKHHLQLHLGREPQPEELGGVRGRGQAAAIAALELALAVAEDGKRGYRHCIDGPLKEHDELSLAVACFAAASLAWHGLECRAGVLYPYRDRPARDMRGDRPEIRDVVVEFGWVPGWQGDLGPGFAVTEG